MQRFKLNFLFALAVFRCLLNDITLKGFLLQHCVVFLLYCVVIVISEPFFAGFVFGLIFLLSDRKRLRFDIFGLKQN